MVGSGWMDKPKAVSLSRSRVTRTPPEVLWSRAAHDESALLSGDSAVVTPVPGTAGRLACVEEWTNGRRVRLVERLPVTEPWTSVAVDHSSGITIKIAVTQARGGSRLALELSCTEPRALARQRLDLFEVIASTWLDTVTRRAAGLEPPELPTERPAAGEIAPALASIPGSRVVAATPAEVWELISAASREPRPPIVFWFRTPSGPVAVGDQIFVVAQSNRMLVQLQEVTRCVYGTLLALQTVAGGHHPAVDTCSLAADPGGTMVTLNHECATSHVGLPPVVEQGLDRLQERLAER